MNWLASLSVRQFGFALAFAIFLADQAHKFWMLEIFDIRRRQPVHVTPFLDLVMAWNPGISYSLLRADSPAGRWGLVAATGLIIALLLVWMWKSSHKLLAAGLGLIAGGALGNLMDRIVYGAVADFFHFYIDTENWGRLSWYVFNVADVAIVAGVALLLYDSIRPQPPETAAGGQEAGQADR
ncbi:MAG: signal peptidase II [Alphaproteobacteria bacterium]|nr:signal peptidase II [Alphaproteobacteria bacterium]